MYRRDIYYFYTSSVIPVTPAELQVAIEQTKAQIYQVKQQIEEASDPQEKTPAENVVTV